MNRRITTAVAIALLGAAGIAGYRAMKHGPPDGAGRHRNPDLRSTSGKVRNQADLICRNEGREGRIPRKRAVEEYATLSAKYGESRTRRAKYIASELIGLMEETISSADFLLNASSSSSYVTADGSMSLASADIGSSDPNLGMTVEQNAKFANLIKNYHQSELTKSKAALESLKKNQAPLMNSLLANDARSRNEISEDAFIDSQSALPPDIKDILNPGGVSASGAGPLSDPDFVRDFRSLLTPEKAKALDARATAASQAPVVQAPAPRSLDSLEQSVDSARKRTQGLNMMMEGLKQMGTPTGALPAGAEPPLPSPAGDARNKR